MACGVYGTMTVRMWMMLMHFSFKTGTKNFIVANN